ncbi:AAA family ATPase [Streptomyces sp. SP18ES09]|uniref:AAA family ATPase n=1 Tax=Streptomyces sp. SP18ES09 TaxID=3002532 RepID=UPI002E7A93D1|nr:AAA family ATPase [Streptomyces sp. SP18ES09]MEE1814247.1 AAA family ATPase [Streptomyces sp. SP18ES09]
MDNVRPMNRDAADHDGFTRVPPHNHDAELYVLGSCIHNPRHIPALRNLITGADFYRPAHELIWTVIGELFDAGQPTEPVALTRALEKRKDLHRAGGSAYISNLASYSWPSPEYYAGFIREAADLRDAEELGRRISQYAYEPDAEPARVVTFIDDYLTRQKERTAGRSGDPADALLAELLDTNALDNMPTLEPLVGDLLHLDSLARIIGPSGHMKSFVVIDIAAHVGTGKPWHGHHVTQGTVVYLVAEGHRGIRKRVRAWEKHHGMKMDNVLFLPRPVQTRGPEWDTWIEAMRRLAPSLIVIDTQARVSVGVEENSNTELGLVVERLDDLRRATGACVLPIHHTGHIGEHGRGASAAKGALQSEFHVSKKGDNASNIIVTMKVGKQKDDEEGDDLQFGLRVVTLDGEQKPDGRPVTSVVLESLDVVLAKQPAEPGTPAWLVAKLDAAGIPVEWGAGRVTRWMAGEDIKLGKPKIEEALRIRKSRTPQTGTGDDNSGAHTWTDDTIPGTPSESLSDCTGIDLPRDLPRTDFNEPPRESRGRPREVTENPRSDIPPQAGGGPGDGPTKPPSPRSPSREGGGAGSEGEQDPSDTPRCTVCGDPLHGYRLDRGYTTCLQHDAA